jgi:hypothetical protein
VGHSLSPGRGNRSGRFCPELPKNLSKRKTASRTTPPLNKNSHNTTETFSLKNSSRHPTGLNRSDRFVKPVRPVLPGESGKTQPAEKNSTHQAIDLPTRSMDQSETLGIVGVTHGLPSARSSISKTHSIKRNRKSTLKNTFPWKPPKTPKSNPFRRDQDHQAKRHKVLIRDIQQESLKETPPKLPHGNSKRRLQKSPKKKNVRNTTKPWGTTPNHLYIP